MTERWTAGSLAARVGAACEGDPERVLTGVASLPTAGPHEVSFCTGARWAGALRDTRAGAVLVPPGLTPPPTAVALRCGEPRAAFAELAALLHPPEWPAPTIHPTAVIDPTAHVAPDVTVEPYVVVGAGAVIGARAWLQSFVYVGAGVTIGAAARLMPGVVVLERCTIGARVQVHPGAVIGADGFGHAIGPAGITRVPQLGSVRVADDVEIGANTCVDRAALDETSIGRGTRIDNLVQVAHNVQIGEQCVLAAFAGLAGGAVLGDRVRMGGRSAVVDGVRVGSHSALAAGASAARSVQEGARVGGSPARDHGRWLRELAALRQLPGLLRQVEFLERRLAALEEK